MMRGELPARPRGDRVDAERFDPLADLVRLARGKFGDQDLRRSQAGDLVEHLPFAIRSSPMHAPVESSTHASAAA